MEHWTDILTDGSASVKKIFDDVLPGLENVEIQELIFHRDGPRVSLRFDLAEFPNRPPKKWVVAGANKVQIVLLAISVCDVKLSGVITNAKINLKIKKESSLISVHGIGDGFEAFIKTEFLMINGISGYKDA